MDMSPTPIAALRKELGLTLEEFGGRIGLASKGNASVIERENRCSLAVALKIEALSGGRIDAASICDDVRQAREAMAGHAAPDTAPETNPSPGKIDADSPRSKSEAA